MPSRPSQSRQAACARPRQGSTRGGCRDHHYEPHRHHHFLHRRFPFIDNWNWSWQHFHNGNISRSPLARGMRRGSPCAERRSTSLFVQMVSWVATFQSLCRTKDCVVFADPIERNDSNIVDRAEVFLRRTHPKRKFLLLHYDPETLH